MGEAGYFGGMSTEARIGRPTLYTPEVVERLCELISSRREGLEDICDSEEGLPDSQTVYKWLGRYDEFGEKYARAREAQSEIYVQDMVKIASGVDERPEAINKARLRIDTLKWAASKLKPKKYGDSTILRGDKENPLDIGLAALLDSAGARRATLPAIEGEAIHEGNTGQLTRIAKPE